MRGRPIALALVAVSFSAACAQAGDDTLDLAGRGGGGQGGRSGAGGSRVGGVSGATAGEGGEGGSSGAGGSGGTGGRSFELLPNAEAILMGQCARWSKQSLLLPSNLLFVVDRSASMSCNPPPITDSVACEAAPTRASVDMPSKWEVMREALRSALLALPDETVVGLTYFSNDDGCGLQSRVSLVAVSAHV